MNHVLDPESQELHASGGTAAGVWIIRHALHASATVGEAAQHSSILLLLCMRCTLLEAPSRSKLPALQACPALSSCNEADQDCTGAPMCIVICPTPACLPAGWTQSQSCCSIWPPPAAQQWLRELSQTLSGAVRPHTRSLVRLASLLDLKTSAQVQLGRQLEAVW